jgi:hypothetical protein
VARGQCRALRIAGVQITSTAFLPHATTAYLACDDAFCMWPSVVEKERRKLGCPPKFLSPKLMRPCAVFGHAADVFVIECCVIFQMPVWFTRPALSFVFTPLMYSRTLYYRTAADTMRFAKLHYYVRLVALSTITLNWVAIAPLNYAASEKKCRLWH